MTYTKLRFVTHIIFVCALLLMDQSSVMAVIDAALYSNQWKHAWKMPAKLGHPRCLFPCVFRVFMGE